MSERENEKKKKVRCCELVEADNIGFLNACPRKACITQIFLFFTIHFSSTPEGRNDFVL
jgi:hypothetical protein